MPYVSVWAARSTWVALRKARVTQPGLDDLYVPVPGNTGLCLALGVVKPVEYSDQWPESCNGFLGVLFGQLH